MSLGPLHEIDRACLDYLNAFDLQSSDADERIIVARNAQLSLGMSAIRITYRDQVQEEAGLAEVDPNSPGRQGKPSVEIRTWHASERWAKYDFYRGPELVLVNNFRLPTGEARKLNDAEKTALDASSETRGVYSELMSRVLNPAGIERIVEDIDHVTSSKLYGQDLAFEYLPADFNPPEPIVDSL